MEREVEAEARCGARNDERRAKIKGGKEDGIQTSFETQMGVSPPFGGGVWQKNKMFLGQTGKLTIS